MPKCPIVRRLVRTLVPRVGLPVIVKILSVITVMTWGRPLFRLLRDDLPCSPACMTELLYLYACALLQTGMGQAGLSVYWSLGRCYHVIFFIFFTALCRRAGLCFRVALCLQVLLVENCGFRGPIFALFVAARVGNHCQVLFRRVPVYALVELFSSP